MSTFILRLQKRKKLSYLAILLGIFFFLPNTVLWLFYFNTENTPSAIGLAFGFWHFLLCGFLLGHLEIYLLVCTGIGGLLLISVWREAHSWKMKGILLSVAAMLLIFMLAPYRTPVMPADGYRMVVPTAPSLLFRGLKNVQAIGEYKPCRYELLGWQQKTLFYESVCDNDQVRIWNMTPESDSQPKEWKASAPTTLSKEQLTHQATLEQVTAKRRPSPSAPGIYVREPGILSPDGKWVALISKYVYGPEDVLILTPE